MDMSDCNICGLPSNKFSARPLTFAPDEKLAFVERVCELLIEDRFGPGGYYESLSESYIAPELEPAAICDLTLRPLVPADVAVSVANESLSQRNMEPFVQGSLYGLYRNVTTFARPPSVSDKLGICYF